ncbi:MAG: ribosome biogenesis GTP-binding protein YihA/YsxC [Alphaproteobacteria bacterium]
MGDHETPRDGEEKLSEGALEAGRVLFAQSCEFFAGATRAAVLPPPRAPEIAFAGRSNVGKSSLVNALTGRHTLARISNTPGRTQQINFFDLGGRLTLVDLPGYGHAQVSKDRVAEWSAVVRLYLKGRPTLRRVLLLIDARHGPKPVDRSLMAELDRAAVSYQVVLTKADKLRENEIASAVAAIAAALAKHGAAHPDVLPTSAETGAGIAELRAHLARLATPRTIR